MKEMETERLLLRHIVESDAEDFFEYCKNPNVGPAAGWKPHENIEETRKLMDEIFIGQENVFGMVVKSNGKLIGSIGLIPDPRRTNPRALMLGYAMSEDYWGQGLMTKASKVLIANGFKELPIDIITCSCYTNNPRSRRVIEKCGFKYEGCLKQCELRFDGEILDLECYSLLEKDMK